MAAAKKIEIKSDADAVPLTKYEFPSEAIGIGKSLLGTSIYSFRMVRYSTMTTGGAGSLRVYVSTALDQYQESASLTALFDEVKMTHTEFNCVSLPTVTGTTAFDVFVGFRNQQDLIAPTPSSVARLPNMKQYLVYPGPSLIVHLHVVATSMLKNRPWGVTSTDLASSSSAAITSGCLGQWEVCDTGAVTVPNTTKALSYVIITVAKFRCRS
jgi:hypothetical protein